MQIDTEQLKDRDLDWLKTALENIRAEITYNASRLEELSEIESEDQELLTQFQAKIRELEGQSAEEGDSFTIPTISVDINSIRRKLKDADKFVTNLKSSDISEESREDLQNQLNSLRVLTSGAIRLHDSLSHIIDQMQSSISELKKSGEDNPDILNVARHRSNLEKYSEDFISRNQDLKEEAEKFESAYHSIIRSNSTQDLYIQYAEAEAEQKIDELDIEKVIENTPMANSQENIERVKFMMNAEHYLKKHAAGEDQTLPNFFKLDALGLYDKEDGKVKAEDFPKYFKELTGLDVSVFDAENPIKAKKIGEQLTQKYVGNLSKKERQALKKELDEKEDNEDKRSLLSYLSIKDEEEQEEYKLSKRKNIKGKISDKVATLDRVTDPYVNPKLQARSKALHSAFGEMKSGNVWGGIVDLTRLPEIRTNPSLSEQFKGMLSGFGNKLVDGASSRVGNSKLGLKAKTKRLQVSIKIHDKTKSIKRKKRKSKKAGKSLLSFLLRYAIKEIVGEIIDTVKDGYRAVKRTSVVSRASGAFTSSRVGQSLQKVTTTSMQGIKKIVGTGSEVKNGIVESGRNLYKAADSRLYQPIIKPAARIIRDMGYVGSTSIKKFPKSLIYGGAAGIIAATTGLPVIPIFIGGTVVGNVVETVHHIMHNPTIGTRSSFVQWLQRQGSAAYLDPVSKSLSQSYFNSNPALREVLEKTGNIYGGRAARIFGAAKSGLMWGLIGGAIGSILGINPLLAGTVSFVAATGINYAFKTITGQRIAQKLLSGIYQPKIFSRLAGIPATKILFHVGNAQVVNSLVQDFVDSMRSGRGAGDFFKKNFTFEGADGPFGYFHIISNYIGSLGYLSTANFMAKFAFSRFLASKSAMGISGGLGTSTAGAAGAAEAAQVIGNLTRAMRFLNFLKLTAAPTLVIAASSMIGLGIAAALGVPIGGIGAVVGSLAGGLIGIGIGAGLAAVTGGALLPLVAVFNAIGTGLGAWIGSMFDKAVDGAIKALFSVVGAISMLFMLIDMFYNGLNFKRIVFFAMSLALALPGITAMQDKAAQSQSESSPTTERKSGTIVMLTEKRTETLGVEIVKDTELDIAVEALSPLIYRLSEVEKTTNKQVFIVLSDKRTSDIFYNEENIIVTMKVNELNPEDKLEELLTRIAIDNNSELLTTSSSQL